jgi:dihydrofolate synthase / folylpolyglutamate synthase
MTSPYLRALERLLQAPTRPKFGLTRMTSLLHELGDPQRQFATIHVAGTKGKGSTCAFVDSILGVAGVSRGMTTSPHLSCARERITLDGEMISEARFAALERRIHAAVRALGADEPSFFERMIAMAFVAFAEDQVRFAVVEVGMGGRLDATNTCVPAACAITQLGLDHTQFLGDTVTRIAAEKAGIAKPGVPVFTIDQGDPDVMAVLEAQAREHHAPLHVVPAFVGAVGIAGRGQADNAALATSLVRAVLPTIGHDVIDQGLRAVRWPCRMEWIDSVLLDGAHNPLSAAVLRQSLPLDRRPQHLLWGMSDGHSEAAFAAALQVDRFASIVATAVPHPRAVPPGQLAHAAVVAGARCVDVVSWPAALAVAMTRAADDSGVVVVTGSLFVAGSARSALLPSTPTDPAWPLF